MESVGKHVKQQEKYSYIRSEGQGQGQGMVRGGCHVYMYNKEIT